MNGFRALLIEGLFHEDASGRFLCGMDGKKTDVWAELRGLVGQRIRFAAHHLPSSDLDATQWGGGACMWQPMGFCPAGHHEKPMWLFNLVCEGLLVETEGVFTVEAFNGKVVTLNLSEMLNGHQARVAAATVLSVEQMRDALGAVSGVEDLGLRADDLRVLLERLRSRGRV